MFSSLAPAGFAQEAVWLPKPGSMVALSPAFTPAVLKGITVHPENPLMFDFIIYKGDKVLSNEQKQEEYKKLIKYFLASLAIPDEDQWVNLSPYEKNRIIKDDFGKTLMGRDLLAQDYILKQITASLIYPEQNLGKKFWNMIYAKTQAQYGLTNVPVNTFNKVWIVPDNAELYEKGNAVFLIKSHLKVMMEEDYLALQKHNGIQNVPEAQKNNPSHAIASKIVKQIIIPEIEKEVNEDKNFANLRQAYSGMILAAWYKRSLKKSLLGVIYANRGKIKGVDQDPRNNNAIYERYLQAYKKGVFNYIKEDVDRLTNEVIPRKYFSGGIIGVMKNFAQIAQFDSAMKAEPIIEMEIRKEDDVRWVAQRAISVSKTETKPAAADGSMSADLQENPLRVASPESLSELIRLAKEDGIIYVDALGQSGKSTMLRNEMHKPDSRIFFYDAYATDNFNQFKEKIAKALGIVLVENSSDKQLAAQMKEKLAGRVLVVDEFGSVYLRGGFGPFMVKLATEYKIPVMLVLPTKFYIMDYYEKDLASQLPSFKHIPLSLPTYEEHLDMLKSMYENQAEFYRKRKGVSDEVLNQVEALLMSKARIIYDLTGGYASLTEGIIKIFLFGTGSYFYHLVQDGGDVVGEFRKLMERIQSIDDYLSWEREWGMQHGIYHSGAAGDIAVAFTDGWGRKITKDIRFQVLRRFSHPVALETIMSWPENERRAVQVLINYGILMIKEGQIEVRFKYFPKGAWEYLFKGQEGSADGDGAMTVNRRYAIGAGAVGTAALAFWKHLQSPERTVEDDYKEGIKTPIKYTGRTDSRVYQENSTNPVPRKVLNIIKEYQYSLVTIIDKSDSKSKEISILQEKTRRNLMEALPPDAVKTASELSFTLFMYQDVLKYLARFNIAADSMLLPDPSNIYEKEYLAVLFYFFEISDMQGMPLQDDSGNPLRIVQVKLGREIVINGKRMDPAKEPIYSLSYVAFGYIFFHYDNVEKEHRDFISISEGKKVSDRYSEQELISEARDSGDHGLALRYSVEKMASSVKAMPFASSINEKIRGVVEHEKEHFLKHYINGLDTSPISQEVDAYIKGMEKNYVYWAECFAFAVDALDKGKTDSDSKALIYIVIKIAEYIQNNLNDFPMITGKDVFAINAQLYNIQDDRLRQKIMRKVYEQHQTERGNEKEVVAKADWAMRVTLPVSKLIIPDELEAAIKQAAGNNNVRTLSFSVDGEGTVRNWQKDIGSVELAKKIERHVREKGVDLTRQAVIIMNRVRHEIRILENSNEELSVSGVGTEIMKPADPILQMMQRFQDSVQKAQSLSELDLLYFQFGESLAPFQAVGDIDTSFILLALHGLKNISLRQQYVARGAKMAILRKKAGNLQESLSIGSSQQWFGLETIFKMGMLAKQASKQNQPVNGTLLYLEGDMSWVEKPGDKITIFNLRDIKFSGDKLTGYDEAEKKDVELDLTRIMDFLPDEAMTNDKKVMLERVAALRSAKEAWVGDKPVKVGFIPTRVAYNLGGSTMVDVKFENGIMEQVRLDSISIVPPIKTEDVNKGKKETSRAMTAGKEEASKAMVSLSDAVTIRNTSERRNDLIINFFGSDLLKKITGLDLSKGHHVVVNIGAGAYPFDSMALKAALNGHYHNPLIDVYDTEQVKMAPIAFVRSPFFEPIVRKLIELKVIGVEPENIRDIFLVVNKLNRYSEMDLDYIDEFGFRSFMTFQDDKSSVRHYGKIGGNRSMFSFSSLSENFLVDRLHFPHQKLMGILEKGVDYESSDVSVQIDPYKKLYEEHGIKFLATDDFGKSQGFKDVSVFMANNLTMHLNTEEMEEFKKQIQVLLMPQGVLGIYNEAADPQSPVRRVFQVYQKTKDGLVLLGTLNCMRNGSTGFQGFEAYSWTQGSVHQMLYNYLGSWAHLGMLNLDEILPGVSNPQVMQYLFDYLYTHMLTVLEAVNVHLRYYRIKGIIPAYIPDLSDPDEAMTAPGRKKAIVGRLDKATISQVPTTGTEKDLGGIDFNSANLAMLIKRDGKGVVLPLAQQDLAQLSNIEGLEPEILSIKPASQSPVFASFVVK